MYCSVDRPEPEARRDSVLNESIVLFEDVIEIGVAPRLSYCMETVGTEPVVFYRIAPAGQVPSYPESETPTPVPGYTYVKVKITSTTVFSSRSLLTITALTFRSCVLDRCDSRCTRIPARHPTVQDTKRCVVSNA